jgi:hypothetical protein
MKLQSVKTFEAVQLPNNFSNFFTLYGCKSVDEITLVNNAYVLVAQGIDLVLIPLSNVCYATLPISQDPIQELKEQLNVETEKVKSNRKPK